MFINCNKKNFKISDKIILSSKTFKDLEEDCSKDVSYIVIPDKFEDILNFITIDFYDIGDLIKTNKKVFEDMVKYDFISSKCYNNIISKLDKEIIKNLKLLELYDFLNVDEKYIAELSKKIGEYVEKNRIDIDNHIQNLLLKYHPILNYYEKYGLKDINSEELPKFVSLYFHKNIKSFKVFDYCEFGNFEMVKYLYKDKHKEKLLLIASENGHLEIVKFLVSEGADIHIESDYSLRWACYNGHLDVVIFLVSEGADINANGFQPLRNASEKGYYDIVEFLVSKGATVNGNNDIALISAIINDHVKIIRFLVSKGANIYGGIPLIFASLYGY